MIRAQTQVVKNPPASAKRNKKVQRGKIKTRESKRRIRRVKIRTKRTKRIKRKRKIRESYQRRENNKKSRKEIGEASLALTVIILHSNIVNRRMSMNFPKIRTQIQ